MHVFTLSIRTVLGAVLGAVAVLVIGLSLYSTHQLRNVAIGFHAQSLQSLLQVLAKRELHALAEKAGELGQFAQSGGNLQRLLRRPDDELTAWLDRQFHQKYVTLGIVKLHRLRVYGPTLEAVAESAEGAPGLPRALPQALRRKAAGRQGAERMKRVDALWAAGGRPYHSTLVPIGGLRLSGYLEIVADPTHQLRHMHGALGSPLRLVDADGAELFASEDWSLQDAHHAAVGAALAGDDGAAVLHMEVLSDRTALEAGNERIRQQLLGLSGILGAVLLGLVFWLLRTLLFQPTERLVATMTQAATGDLTVTQAPYALRELARIAAAFDHTLEAMRTQVQSIRDSGTRVAHETEALKRIAAGCTETARRQQDGVARVASAMTEMAASAHQVAASAEETAGSAQQVDRDATTGAAKARAAAGEVDTLVADLGATAAAIDRLGAETTDIDTILDAIRGIADQTNLLALNASIEAARAGEQGRGFAVVADEVRSLAQKTQESTVDIRRRIEALQQSAGDAVRAMQEAQHRAGASHGRVREVADALDDIERSVARINDMTAQIAGAAEQQSATSEAVSRDATTIHASAEDTASAATAIEQAADELARLAGTLESDIARFAV